MDLAYLCHGYDGGSRIGHHFPGNGVDALLRGGVHDIDVLVAQPHADVAGSHIGHHDLGHAKGKRPHKIGDGGGSHGSGPGDDPVYFAGFIHLHNLLGAGLAHHLDGGRAGNLEDFFLLDAICVQYILKGDVRPVADFAAATVHHFYVAAGFFYLLGKKFQFGVLGVAHTCYDDFGFLFHKMCPPFIM